MNCVMYGAGYGLAGAVIGGFAGWGMKAVTNQSKARSYARTYTRPQARANDAWLNEEDMLI
jgi:hypothetical protein